MVQPYLQNPAKSGKVANTTGTNSQLRGKKTQIKNNVTRKGPAGELCVTGTDVQTQAGSPGCIEPSWGCHRWLWTSFSPHELDWWFQPPFPPWQWDSLPKQNSCQAVKGATLFETLIGTRSLPFPPFLAPYLPPPFKVPQNTIWQVPS